jgi:hypothetical protein
MGIPIEVKGFDSEATRRHEEKHVQQLKELVDALPLVVNIGPLSACSTTAVDAEAYYQSNAETALSFWKVAFNTMISAIKCSVIEKEAYEEITRPKLLEEFHANIADPGGDCSGQIYYLSPRTNPNGCPAGTLCAN